jgi:hypothetical protein
MNAFTDEEVQCELSRKSQRFVFRTEDNNRFLTSDQCELIRIKLEASDVIELEIACSTAPGGIDKIFIGIGRNKSIRTLRIHGQCKVDNIVLFSQALKANDSIRMLYLKDCGIDEIGMNQFAGILFGKCTKRIKYIDLSGNNIGDSGCIQLVHALERNFVYVAGLEEKNQESKIVDLLDVDFDQPACKTWRCKVILNRCEIGDKGIEAVIQFLQKRPDFHFDVLDNVMGNIHPQSEKLCEMGLLKCLRKSDRTNQIEVDFSQLPLIGNGAYADIFELNQFLAVKRNYVWVYADEAEKTSNVTGRINC